MMTLYHGSHVAVPQPLAMAGRNNLDFGRGFYLTALLPQAQTWAAVVASRSGRTATPVVSIYEFDDDAVREQGTTWHRFVAYDLEWLDYVVACRRGKDTHGSADIVEGGVANDNVIDTVENYEKGIITAEQALGQLKYKKVNHQLCIHSQWVIDRYLKFKGEVCR